MASNNMQVSLSFTADTQRARQEIQNLQNSLRQLGQAAPQSLVPGASTEEIVQAQQAVTKLQVALRNATNVDTGKLNLTKFNTSLAESGMNLEQYRKQLQNLGPQGQQAFLDLTNSIMSADTALKHTNKLFDSLWHAFKQTAKFQFTASIYRGLTSGISSAFQYAEDLNRSLNDIRIVTGNSTEEMARFADQANRAAKALSTSTKEYADASLIYFQQGLSDQEVQERTDITIKMANASGQSAEIVSDQLTAVWNNFYDGSKSLEYYADVMTKLGAETASSADEIAGGLEKFAAIGDTIGLSYEYAASALATITAQTRQSEDVVGTALKTIFARIQGLQLGETLDDGVSLNKYSEALQSVGISIFDQAGELKNMDNILEEMGAKWGTLSKAQQTALAQTVAGVRQYNQLISLMDNWDVMQDNLDISYGASGTLQEQADIYAESWEAAQKRVQAAAEGVYKSLINDEFFIDLNNGLADLLGMIEKVIDSMGGVKGTIGALGLIFTKIFNQQITNSIANMTQSLYSMSAAGKQAAQSLKTEAYNQSMSMLTSVTGGDLSAQDNAIIQTQKIRLQLQQDLVNNAKNMTQEEIQLYQHMLDNNRAYEERVRLSAQTVDEARDQFGTANRRAQDDIILNNMSLSDEDTNEIIGGYNMEVTLLKENIGEVGQVLRSAFAGVDIQGESGLQNIISILDGVEVNGEEAKIAIEQLKLAAKNVEESGSDSHLFRLRENIQKLIAPTDQARRKFIDFVTNGLDVTREHAERVAEAILELNAAEENNKRTTEDYRKQIESLRTSLSTTATNGFKQFAQGVTGTFQGISSFTMGINSLRGALDTLKNPDMSTWEKVSSIMMSLGMGIPSLISGINMLKTSWSSLTGGIVTAITATSSALVVEQMQETQSYKTLVALKAKAEAKGEEAVVEQIDQELKKKSLIIEQTQEALKQKSLGTQLLFIAAKKIGIPLQVTETGAIVANTAAEGANNVQRGIAVVLEALLNQSMAMKIAIIAGLVVAIAGLVAIVWVIVKAYEAWKASSPEAKLVAAEEKAKKAGEAFQQASERVDNLKESIESLKDSYDAIDKVTGGAEELSKAISNANEKALELIDNYPQLQKYASIGEGGLIQIDETGLDAIEREEANRMNAAYGVKLQADIDEIEARINYEQTKFSNQNGIYIKNESYQQGGQNITSQQDLYNALSEEYNTEGIGDSLFTDESLKKFYEKTYGEFESSFKEGTEQFNIELQAYNERMESVNEVIKENREQIIKIANLQGSKDLLLESQETSTLSQIASSMGSIVSGEQIKDLGVSYSAIKTQQKKETEKMIDAGGGLGWQDRLNYSGEEDWIKTFVSAQGTNARYIAQRSGKMVIEIDGQEKEFSREEVLDYLTEFYSSDEIRSSITETFRENLRVALGDSVDNLSEQEIVGISNLKTVITDAIIPEGTSEEMKAELEKAANTYINALSSYFGGTEELGKQTSYLGSASAESLERLKQKSLELAQGTIAIEEYAEAFQMVNAEGRLNQLATDLDAFAEAHDLNSDELKDYAKYIMEIAKESEELSDELATNADAAANYAKQVVLMNKGIETLGENFEDWNSILKKSSKTSVEYMNALSGMRKSLGDVLGVDGTELSGDFIKANLDLIGKAAEGNGEAIDKLRSKLDEEIIAKVTARATTEQAIEDINNFDAKIKEIAATFPDIEVGATLQDEAFLQAANDLVTKAGMTADEANAYFAGIGYEPVYNTTEIPQANSMSMPNAMTSVAVTGLTWSQENLSIGDTELPIKMPAIKIETKSEPLPPVDTEGPMQLTSFSGDGTPPPIRGLTKKAPGSANNYSSKNSGGTKTPVKSSGGKSGGSGSKKKPKDAIKPKDEITRFRDTDAALEKQSRLLEDIGRVKDGLWGAKYIAQIDAENDALERQNELYDKQIEDAKDARDNEDKYDLLTKYGIELELDDEGNIVNYEAIEKRIYDIKQKAVEAYNSSAMEEADEEAYEDAIEFADEIKELVDDYDEAQSKVIEGQKAKEENLQKIRENNFDKINHKLEVKLQLQENEVKLMEAYNALLGEDWDNAPEVFVNSMKTNMTAANDTLHAYSESFKELDAQFKAKQISQADFVEGSQNVLDGLTDGVQQWVDISKEVEEAYSNMLDSVLEDMEALDEELAHLVSMTENFQSILELIGKSSDYNLMGDLLESRKQIQKVQYEQSKADYEMLLQQQVEAQAKLDADPENETLKKNLEKAKTEVREAQSEMYDNYEAYLQTMADLRDNALAQSKSSLEQNLFGMSAEEMSEQLDYLQAKQEDYLTATNQHYETEKLLRTASLAIENTENEVAKRKLELFKKETKELQDQNKLSNFELEVQQAKYELLLAEIALQEAQNTKSQVRLQRDSEGNFNYVYTADQDKIAEAEQNYADAENNLYNIRLEGANEYAQKYTELMMEMLDKMQAVHDDETLSTEEKNAKLEQIYEQYYDRLKDVQSIYSIAAEGLSDKLNEAWTTDIMDSIATTEEFKSSTQIYLGECETALNDWEDVADEALGLVKADLDTVTDSVEEVGTAMTTLREDAGNELSKMQDNVAAWSVICSENIEKVTSYYMELARVIGTVVEAQAGFDADTDWAGKYESSITASEARAALVARDTKLATNEDFERVWGKTEDFVRNDNDEMARIQRTDISDGARVDAALRRVGKLQYLKESDSELAQKYYEEVRDDDFSITRNALIAGFRGEQNFLNFLTDPDLPIKQAEELYRYFVKGTDLNSEDLQETLRKRGVALYDTGGYTGEFGPEGRLAFLHEKELVLNQNQTKDLLDTIDIVDKLLNNIEHKALMQSFGNRPIASWNGTVGETLEQEVTIHAEFPNVQDRNEIEEAFSNLINTASQYANRKSH